MQPPPSLAADTLREIREREAARHAYIRRMIGWFLVGFIAAFVIEAAL
jgi:hypothetical protein